MQDERGHFIKGTHWRKPQAFRDAEWLRREYVEKQRSTGDIAAEFEVTDGAILFWLRKHGIPRRSVSEARQAKHWGSDGESNPMYGKRGAEIASWKGGVTPDRQAFYSSPAWALAVKTIWQRDQGKCRRCGAEPKARGEFHIHHIVSFSVVELRVELTNLALLCGACHRWVHSRANTERLYLGEKGGAE